MIVLLDDKVRSGSAMRTVMYQEDGELIGNKVVTMDGLVVECAPGSVALKAGFKDMLQLDADGVWQAL